MTRHGSNATASSVYSYSERKKDAKQSGYGTLNERVGADAIKPFDCCSLSLQPCKNPMITPDGYIFDKEAILSYIVEQKKEQKRQMKAYEKYEAMEIERKQQQADAESEEKRRTFMAMETTPAHLFARTYATAAPAKRKAEASTSRALEPYAKRDKRDATKANDVVEDVSNMAGEKAKEWRSFWVPELQPTVTERIEKPSDKVLNPLSNKPIRFKDLMPVVFTLVSDAANTTLVHSMAERYKCAVTGDVLTNSTRAAYIKPSQRVVSWRCIEKIIRKDMIDPVTNSELEEADIIELQRGGTGFAATNETKAKAVRPQLELA